MSWSAQFELVLDRFTLSVDLQGNGGPRAVVGPNGAGKSTLLRTLAGAHRPAHGSLHIGGRCVFDRSTGVDVAPEHRHVGFLPQGFGLFPHLNVLDNVAYGAPGKGREAALAELERFGVAQLAERLPARLSGGECQAVALARALLRSPQLLLLDEPLSALDLVARRAARRQLAEHLAVVAVPALVVTHDPADVLELGADVVVLEAGKVVQEGSPEQLCAAPATAFAEAFFGASRGA
jgi:molybdate transport system ATP-binding protein